MWLPVLTHFSTHFLTQLVGSIPIKAKILVFAKVFTPPAPLELAGLFHSRIEIPDCISRKPFLAIPSRIFHNFRSPIRKYRLKPLQHIG